MAFRPGSGRAKAAFVDFRLAAADAGTACAAEDSAEFVELLDLVGEMEGAAPEDAVLRLLDDRQPPRALPWAGIVRTFGAQSRNRKGRGVPDLRRFPR